MCLVMSGMDTGNPKSLHFFISRASEDTKWAQWIASTLEAAGYATTIQDWDFRPGQNFILKMKEALEAADHVIAVLSNHYLAKMFTQAEMYSSIADDAIGERRFLIPVRIEECELPRLMKGLIYVDLVGKDQNQARKDLLSAVSTKPKRREAPFPESIFPAVYRTFVNRLPIVDPVLIGRDNELGVLDRAWANPATNFVQVVAAGGTGKTALADKWFRRHLGEATIFGWSFYSQGTSENRHTSSDPFFAEVLPFFNIEIPLTSSIYTRAEVLARSLRTERILLVLDGIEPLQESSGTLRDLGLRALLQELATLNKGMVLCTTRLRLTDIPDDSPRSCSIDLDNLDSSQGAEYLRHLGVIGLQSELRQASEEFANHALALTLLGSYLVDFCGGDVRRRVDIPSVLVDDTRAGAHARRVMQGYARMFAGTPELEVLRALGYFDRPVEPEALRLVLPAMSNLQYLAAVKRLSEARLILAGKPVGSTADPMIDCHPIVREHFSTLEPNTDQPVDCHPLVREHFADVMRSSAPQVFRAGHKRLYEYYRTKSAHLPNKRDELVPLFWAVYHGCQAGEFVPAFRDVYLDRISRGNEFYLTDVLGEFGTDLSLLANFFVTPWTQTVEGLTLSDQSRVISQSHFALRGLGRLTDAVDQLQHLGQTGVDLKIWSEGIVRYSNLSQLLLMLGYVAKAISTARKALELIQPDDIVGRMMSLVDQADALHQAGDFENSERIFEKAEQIHAMREPGYPILYSVPNYRYCDLLLTQGKQEEALHRATTTLEWAGARARVLDIGLSHLVLGRAHPKGSSQSAFHLDQAVELLRQAGSLVHLPVALLARGTQPDLELAYMHVRRSGMRLRLIDYHLAQTRLHLSKEELSEAKEHYYQAEELTTSTGYHRIDPALIELRSILFGKSTSGTG